MKQIYLVTDGRHWLMISNQTPFMRFHLMIPDRSIKTKALQLTNNTVPSRHRLQLQGRRREENGKSPHPRVASSVRRLGATETIPHRWLLPGRHRCSPASACSFSGGQSRAAAGSRAALPPRLAASSSPAARWLAGPGVRPPCARTKRPCGRSLCLLG